MILRHLGKEESVTAFSSRSDLCVREEAGLREGVGSGSYLVVDGQQEADFLDSEFKNL